MYKQLKSLIAFLDVLYVEVSFVVECQGYEFTALIEIHTDQLPYKSLSPALCFLVIFVPITSVSFAAAAAFDVEFFVPCDLDDVPCYHDFFVVTIFDCNSSFAEYS